MKKKIISCGILARELRQLIKDEDLDIDVTFLSPGLHVDNCQLKNKLLPLLEENINRDFSLLYGCNCHPDMVDWQNEYDFQQPKEPDCIGILLGQEKRKELSQEAKTFYMTQGWLDNWEEIFKQGLGWNEIDARMNFGMYDRILLLETGLWEISDEKMLEFFDYTQVPIEPYTIDLSRLEKIVARMI